MASRIGIDVVFRDAKDRLPLYDQGIHQRKKKVQRVCSRMYIPPGSARMKDLEHANLMDDAIFAPRRPQLALFPGPDRKI
jgi:hypothetical protein